MASSATPPSKMESFSDAELAAFHYGLNLADYIAAITNEWGIAKRKREGEIHTVVHKEFVEDLKIMLERELSVRISWEPLPEGGAGIPSPEDYRVVHIVG
jgi:hypothetical protein